MVANAEADRRFCRFVGADFRYSRTAVFFTDRTGQLAQTDWVIGLTEIITNPETSCNVFYSLSLSSRFPLTLCHRTSSYANNPAFPRLPTFWPTSYTPFPQIQSCPSRYFCFKCMRGWGHGSTLNHLSQSVLSYRAFDNCHPMSTP